MKSSILYENWEKLWNKLIVEQNEWKDIAYYNLISTIVDKMNRQKQVPRDLRTAGIFLSPTASGKDEGVGLIQDILKGINKLISKEELKEIETPFIYMTQNNVTDATLVGSYSEEKERENRRKKTNYEKREQKAKEKGQEFNEVLELEDPIDYGLLQYVDHLSSTEAIKYLQRGRRYSEDALTYIREALNRRRKVTKGLSKAHDISYEAASNLLLCLQPLKIDIADLIHDGSLGRFPLLYQKSITEEEHDAIVDVILEENLGENPNSARDDITILPEYHEFMKSLQEFIIFYSYQINSIRNSEGLVQYAKKVNKEDRELIWNQLDNIDSILLSGYYRLVIKGSVKFAYLTAVSRKSNVVEQSDYDKARDLLLMSLNTVKQILLKTSNDKKLFYVTIELFRKQQFYSKEEFKSQILNSVGFSSRQLGVNILNGLMNQRVIEIKGKDSRKQLLGLTDQIKEKYAIKY